MHQLRTKLYEFSAAHRLIKGYQGKCQNLHGHNYAVIITLQADKLDQYDFVADFGDIKKHCQSWLKENWDHSTIISDADQELLTFVTKAQQKHYIIPEGKNTTVEVLSEHLYKQFDMIVSHQLDTINSNIHLVEVEIWETSTSSAKFCR